jgi:hypothetical protein
MRRALRTAAPLFADVGQQRHETRALDGGARCTLKCGAAPASLAREDLVLIGAEFLQQTDVFVVNVSGSRATVASTKATAILAVTTKFLPRHFLAFLSSNNSWMSPIK